MTARMYLVAGAIGALLVTPLTAQAPTQKPKPAPTPTKQELAQEKTGEAPKTKEQRIAELKAQLDKIRAERASVAEFNAGTGVLGRVQTGLKRRKLEGVKAVVDRGIPTVQPTKSKGVRLLGDDEKTSMPEGTIFTVNGAPVTAAEFESLFGYYKSYPRTDTDEQLKKQVIMDLAVLKATSAMFHATGAVAKQRVAELKKKLDSGEEFKQVATDHSECPSSARGGELGMIGRVGYDPMFTKTAFELKVGETSDVIQTSFGYHLIKVTGEEKGATADQDRRSVSHILALYSPEQQEVRQVQMTVRQGNADLAFASDTWRQFAPDVFLR